MNAASPLSAAPEAELKAAHQAPTQAQQRPASDVSAGVGFAGLAGLVGWIIFCRSYPAIAAFWDLPGPRGVLSGPLAALAGLAATALPMIVWSLLIDRVHTRASTGLDWKRPRALSQTMPISMVKIVGLWATWGVLAALFALCRWYWDGSYLFAMRVLGTSVAVLIIASVPYMIWLDRHLREPRDGTWHFGALLLGSRDAERPAIIRHWRAWIIKAFFGAFMISILPSGFAQIIEADASAIWGNPVAMAGTAIAFLFVIDVQIGTVGYLLTLRPLDAHIRSGNPFLGGWLAALLCYPPFVWGLIGSGNQILSYERGTAGWAHWFAGNPLLLWGWGAFLVALTAAYAWATIAFGIRFSNLTYRGVLTHGPYRFTRHPAYLSKNLFWWFSTLPFLVTSSSPAEAVRNCFFLLLVNAIYYWRARTEEAHLLGEDEKYRAYYDWMEQNGVITAPLSRLKNKLTPRAAKANKPATPTANGPLHPAE